MNHCKTLTLILFLSSMLAWTANAQRIDLNLKDVTVKEAMGILKNRSGYSFVYEAGDIDARAKVSVKATRIEDAISQIVAGQNVSYELRGKNIVLQKTATWQQKVKRTITGIVKDANGLSVIGATILEKGNRTNGVVTDSQGRFTITMSEDSPLIVNCIGYKQIEMNPGVRDNLDIVLEDDMQLLDEVVVVGYDTQKKVNLTGSVSSVSFDQFNNRPVVQSSTALQGVAPGVTVTTGGGAPGSDSGTIRIRGIGTFGGSSASPLVLIDGVQGDLNSLDAALIDKISVLKDAASSAIYGSRAANGVILVTTKRAEKGVSQIAYRGYVGWQQAVTRPDLVNAEEYMTLSREATEHDGGESIYTDEYIKNYRMNNWLDPDAFPITDWQSLLMTGSGLTHNHNVTMSASYGKIRTMASFGYLSQEGIIKSSKYDRYNFRNNLNVDFNDKFRMRLDVSAIYGHRKINPYQSAVFNFMNARDPLMLAKWSDGSYAPFTGGSLNILPMIENGEGGNQKSDVLRISASFGLTYEPAKWLTFDFTYAPRITLSSSHKFIDLVKYHSDPYGSISSITNNSYNYLSEGRNYTVYGNTIFTASFHKTFAKAHNVKLLLGTEYDTRDDNNVSAYRQEFTYPQYDVLSAGADNEFKNNSGTRAGWSLLSYFGRLNYNFKERYLIEGNIRFDGSSRFAKGNRWGIFPSVSGAWRVTEEPFMVPVKNTLTELKFRASYGELGNQNISDSYYPTAQNLTISSISANDIIYPMVGLNVLANEDITWETSRMLDVGIDAVLWNKFSITADWYHKTTDGILMRLDIPSSIGLSAPYQNAGKVRNIGWEVALGYHDRKGDFSYGVNANLSDVRNKILDMKGTTGGSGVIRNQEGSSINSLYGLKCIGMARTQEEADDVNNNCPQFNQATYPGDLIYEDFNKDGKITDDDRQIIGSMIPRYTYGLTLDLGWKGLGLSAQFQGVGKVDGYLSGYFTQPCVQGGTFRKEHLDRWTETTPNGKFPRLSYASELNTKNSSYWMADASYLRLKNLQLSYKLPQSWMKKVRLSSVMFFANATNLFTLTGYYQGYDPETGYQSGTDGATAGSVGSNYPLVSTYTFGVEIKF